MFEIIAWISLGVAFLCSAVIAVDVLRHPQKMGIMNIVWPVSALYGSVIALWTYFRIGRKKAKDFQKPMSEEEHKKMMKEAKVHPKPSQISVAASHCGAGCTLGDIVADFLVFGLALKFWGSDLWASFVIDYIFAWMLGIVFQYFTIAPMRGLSLFPGIWAAIKADTLSITAWQLGMYGFMLLTYFVFFPNPHLHSNQPQYWFMMQFAMIAGFFTAYPMNYILVKTGLQGAYTRALEKSEQIKDTESVVAWFYRVLRNGLVDHYRRDNARARAHERFVAEAPVSYEAEVESDLCTCVGGVVQTLKPEYRRVLERIDLGGQTIADFAQAEGTTANNASVRLHRARRAAAKKLTQVCGACADHKCLNCTCKRRV